MATDEMNGKITWKQVERYAGFAVIIVTLVIYFSDINYKLDRISDKLNTHITVGEQQTKRNLFTHSNLGTPITCRGCMGRP